MYAEILIVFWLGIGNYAGFYMGGGDSGYCNIAVVRAAGNMVFCDSRSGRNDGQTINRDQSRASHASPQRKGRARTGGGTQIIPAQKRSLPAPKNAKLEPWKAEIAAYICTKSWDCRTAVAVAYAESGLNCGAKSPTGDHGVMQLHGQAIYDCRANIDRAYEMYKRRGWQPWSAYKNGRYKRFLSIYQ